MLTPKLSYSLNLAPSQRFLFPQPCSFINFLNSPGDWNGQVNWSDQTAPISNFEYLFNMMDDTPAMEEEVVDDMSMTDTSYKSGEIWTKIGLLFPIMIGCSRCSTCLRSSHFNFNKPLKSSSSSVELIDCLKFPLLLRAKFLVTESLNQIG